MTFKVLISIVVLGKAYSLIANKPKESDNSSSKFTDKAEDTMNTTDVTPDSSHIVLQQSSFIDTIGPDSQSKGSVNSSIQQQNFDVGNSSKPEMSVSSDISSVIGQYDTDNLASADTESVIKHEESNLIEIQDNEKSGLQCTAQDSSGDVHSSFILQDKLDSNSYHQSEELRHRKTPIENEDNNLNNL